MKFPHPKTNILNYGKLILNKKYKGNKMCSIIDLHSPLLADDGLDGCLLFAAGSLFPAEIAQNKYNNYKLVRKTR